MANDIASQMFDIKPASSFGHDTVPYQGYRYGYYGEPYSGHWYDKKGPHTGKGPRGYQRSDERIGEEVNYRLWQHGLLDASNIAVLVTNGVVLLTGTVDDRQAKRLARDIAFDVPGVRDVDNQLRIKKKEHGMVNRDLWQNKIRRGMIVLDTDGNRMGTVKDLGENDFWLDLETRPDTRVPYSDIKDVVENFVRLKISGTKLDKTGIASEQTPFKPVSGGG